MKSSEKDSGVESLDHRAPFTVFDTTISVSGRDVTLSFGRPGEALEAYEWLSNHAFDELCAVHNGATSPGRS